MKVKVGMAPKGPERSPKAPKGSRSDVYDSNHRRGLLNGHTIRPKKSFPSGKLFISQKVQKGQKKTEGRPWTWKHQICAVKIWAQLLKWRALATFFEGFPGLLRLCQIPCLVHMLIHYVLLPLMNFSVSWPHCPISVDQPIAMRWSNHGLLFLA